MRLTEDLTCCESLPDWARHVAAATGADVASFGHTLIRRVSWESGEGYLPLHDVLHFSFLDGVENGPGDHSERHFAEIFQIGTPRTEDGPRLPSLLLHIGREHFDAVIAEHFEGHAFPKVQAHTFLRGTPHGRGLYALAAALMQMIEVRADLFSRYCLEIALIKAIALAPPNMMQIRNKGETWGPMIRRVELAAEFMIQHLQEPFVLASVAKAAECSPRTLGEAFQRYLNLSPLKFHLHCRLEAAYAELARGNQSVTTVALKYGFENQGRFARAFRDRFGLNPSKVPNISQP